MLSLFDTDIWGIIGVSLRMSFASTSISLVLGTLLGLLLERGRFPGKRIVIRINRTMMGVPPVVMGLVVYILFMRRGPFGALDILFTVPAMIIAQVLIITPIICGLVYTAAHRNADKIRAFGITMGTNRMQSLRLMIREMSHEIYFAAIAGFSRAISEVGAVMIVGGNIQGRTRTMTTAIALLRGRGNYYDAIYLGVVLLIIAFLIHLAADYVRRREPRLDENL